jgi:hypothetical protein
MREGYEDHDELIGYLKAFVRLAQERNLLAVESLSELRDANKTLEDIAAAVSTPPPAVPGPLKRAVLIFGSSQ